MNQVILTGNLTRDVEIRYTSNGSAVGNFGLASNRKWRDQAGELKEEVTFVDITAFGKQAETISQYFKKGSKILVQGRLKFDQWDDRQSGQKRSKLSVVLEGFEFMGGNARGDEGSPTPRPAPKATTTRPPTDLSSDDDDVPF